MIRYVSAIVLSRKCMVPEWTVTKLDRTCGCAPAAVDERILGLAKGVAAMNGGGLMNSCRRGQEQMFRRGHKVTIDPRPWQNEADGEVYLEFVVAYTIHDIELGFDEVRNERCQYLDDHGEAPFFAGCFWPVVDLSDLEAIVTEVKRDKPRKIKADKFDRQRIHSSFSAASSPLSMHRDGASSPSRARLAGEALASLALPAHSSRAAAASWPQRLPAVLDAANFPAVGAILRPRLRHFFRKLSRLPGPVAASRRMYSSIDCLS